MSLPGTASPPAVDRRREGDARRAGEAVVNMLRLGITPRMIMTKKAFENAIAVDVGARRLDQRRAAPAGHRQRGRRRSASRRLQPDRRQGAAHRRHEARRQVPHERSRPRRRRAGGDEASARRRPAARRRDDGDRQDDGGEPRRARPAAPRRRRRLPARSAAAQRGWHQRAHRFAGAEGRGGEGRRTEQGADAVRRHGAGVRRRGRRDGCDPGRLGRARHRPGDPLRGPEGWARACARCWPSPAR